MGHNGKLVVDDAYGGSDTNSFTSLFDYHLGTYRARELLVGARETTKQEPSNVYSLQHLTPEDHDVIGLARSELANQQYENAAHLLTLRYGPDRSKYPEIPLFMWAYAMYLVSRVLEHLFDKRVFLTHTRNILMKCRLEKRIERLQWQKQKVCVHTNSLIFARIQQL